MKDYIIFIVLLLCILLPSCSDRYQAIGFSDKAMILDTQTGEVWATEVFDTGWVKKLKLVPIRYPERQYDHCSYTPKDSRSNENLDFFERFIRKLKEEKNKEIK